MFDIGMWEMLVVGIVALIVVGPKDLPKMFRTLGMVTGRLKAMAREFQTTMNAAASEAGFDDMAKDIRKATDFSRDLRKVTSPRKMGVDALKKAASSSIDGAGEADPDKPLSETEKLAQQRHREAEERLAAARKRAAERANAASAAGFSVEPAAEAEPAEQATPEPSPAPANEPDLRTGTSET